MDILNSKKNITFGSSFKLSNLKKQIKNRTLIFAVQADFKRIIKMQAFLILFFNQYRLNGISNPFFLSVISV